MSDALFTILLSISLSGYVLTLAAGRGWLTWAAHLTRRAARRSHRG